MLDRSELINDWLSHAQNVMQKPRALLAAFSDTEAGIRRLYEGWVSWQTDGLVRGLSVSVMGQQELSEAYQKALAGL
jgi:hypothetical protein